MRAKLSRTGKWVIAGGVALFLLALCTIALIGSRGDVFFYWASRAVCLRCGILIVTSDMEILGRNVRSERRNETTGASGILYSEKLDAAHHVLRHADSKAMSLTFPAGFKRQSTRRPIHGLYENRALIQALKAFSAEGPNQAREAWYWISDKVDRGKCPQNIVQMLNSGDTQGLLKALRQVNFAPKERTGSSAIPK